MMKNEMFKIVLDLSDYVNDVSWYIEKIMKVLLKDTDANLETLHDYLMMFSIMEHECKSSQEEYYIRKARTLYLKNRYSDYFNQEEKE